MYRRISALVVVLLALTAGRAGADQIYGLTDSALDTGTPEVYVLSIQSLTNAAADDQNGSRQTVANLTKQETHTTAGVFKNLACVLETPPGATKGWNFHLLQNEVLTALNCAVSDSARSCANVTDTITVAAGERVAFQITPFNTPSASRGTCTVTFR